MNRKTDDWLDGLDEEDDERAAPVDPAKSDEDLPQAAEPKANGGGSSELEALANFALLQNQKAEAESRLLAIKAQIGLLETTVSDIMTRNAIQNHTAHGRVLYLDRRLSATKKKEVEMRALVAELQRHVMSDFVTYSPQRLTSYVKELDDEHGEVPEWLTPLINVHEIISVRSRKA